MPKVKSVAQDGEEKVLSDLLLCKQTWKTVKQCRGV